MILCQHFDPIRFKGRCALGNGRMAPRDCGGCKAHLEDTSTGRIREEREQEWQGARMRFERAGT